MTEKEFSEAVDALGSIIFYGADLEFRPCKPNCDVETAFKVTDIKSFEFFEIVPGYEGYNSEDLFCYGELHDGRWFVGDGDCDTTGWDCRGGIIFQVGRTKEDVIRYGMDNEQRERLNLVLEEDHG